tara:strand:- start:644 stop:1456 length:813 start_codon:yes stop_codon:yes gene_type:complete
MIDREKLQYVKNVLSLTNEDVDITELYNLVTAINRNDELYFLTTMFKLLQPETDASLLKTVFELIKEDPSLEKTLLDSFSHNQIAAKTALLNAVDDLKILDKDSTVVMWAGWYGSILIPKLANKVKKIVNIDLDNQTTKVSKKLFNNYENVDYICDDIFKTYRDAYLNTNLIINTSCEHMPPMKDWKWFGAGALSNDQDTSIFRTPKLPDNCYFAFQSNNMFDIEGHVNCVNSLQEFKDQMPERAEILFEEEVEDTRGTRYMLVGKLTSL